MHACECQSCMKKHSCCCRCTAVVLAFFVRLYGCGAVCGMTKKAAGCKPACMDLCRDLPTASALAPCFPPTPNHASILFSSSPSTWLVHSCILLASATHAMLHAHLAMPTGNNDHCERRKGVAKHDRCSVCCSLHVPPTSADQH